MAKTCTPNNPCFTPVSMWGRMLIYPPIASDDWILSTGEWNDAGFWRDDKLWID